MENVEVTSVHAAKAVALFAAAQSYRGEKPDLTHCALAVEEAARSFALADASHATEIAERKSLLECQSWLCVAMAAKLLGLWHDEPPGIPDEAWIERTTREIQDHPPTEGGNGHSEA